MKNSHRAAALAVAFAAALAASPAVAEDDAPDTAILKGLMQSLGFQNGTEQGIDYRERSPLVVPPSRVLPPPQQSANVGNPNWPVDPEAKARRSAAQSGNLTSQQFEDNMRPLRPADLNRGSRTTSARDGKTGRSMSDGELISPSSGAELGVPNVFGMFRKNSEQAVFAGEPPRESLTEPPAGYQTPSPNQPYGSGSENERPKADNYEDARTRSLSK